MGNQKPKELSQIENNSNSNVLSKSHEAGFDAMMTSYNLVFIMNLVNSI